MYGDDDETVIGYRYPIYVDQELDRTDTLIIITFKNQTQLENIDMSSIQASLLLVNP